MKAGIWNLGFGILAILAGASGQFALIGTHSSTALIVAGVALAAFGVFQLARNKGK